MVDVTHKVTLLQMANAFEALPVRLRHTPIHAVNCAGRAPLRPSRQRMQSAAAVPADHVLGSGGRAVLESTNLRSQPREALHYGS